MKILCTFPGKFGDLLWALPTVRAISEAYGEKVDLAIAGAFGSILPLLRAQPYLGLVEALDSWAVQDTAPISPRIPTMLIEPPGYHSVFNLGYEGWPTPTLAQDVYERALLRARSDAVMLDSLDLARPWIRPAYHTGPITLALGFTDEWFELKYGIYWLLVKQYQYEEPNTDRAIARVLPIGDSPRWKAAGSHTCDWLAATAWLATAQLFVGCCSALHVLAVAVGTPVICVEPNAQRHNEVFYPVGKVGPQVRLLLGNDGQPTFDARHLCDAIDQQLAAPAAAAVEA